MNGYSVLHLSCFQRHSFFFDFSLGRIDNWLAVDICVLQITSKHSQCTLIGMCTRAPQPTACVFFLKACAPQ